MKKYSYLWFLQKFRNEIKKGKKILGEIYLSKKEYEKLLKVSSERILGYKKTGFNNKSDLVLAVTLVQAGIYSYTSGNYWDMLDATLNIKTSTNERVKIGQLFLKTLKRYKLPILEVETERKNKYVNNILLHGLIPDDYIDDFFEFLFVFYESNLGRTIPSSLREDIDYLMLFIKDSLESSTSDEVKIAGAKNVKIYKIRKTTKIAMIHFEKRVRILIRHLLKLINAKYWDNIVPKYPKSRFTKKFIEWSKSSNNFMIPSNDVNKTRQRGEKQFSSPYIILSMKENVEFNLVIPSQKINNINFHEKVEIEINFGGVKKVNEELIYDLIIGGIKTREKYYRISNEDLFKPIDINIKSKVIKRYKIDIGEYLIFNEKHINVDKIQTGINYIFVEKHIEVSADNILSKEIIDNNYLLYCIKAEEGDLVLINNKTFYIGDIELYEGLQNHNVLSGVSAIQNNEEKLPVFNKPPKFIVFTYGCDIESIAVIINGQRFRLSEILEQSNFTVFELKDNVKMKAIKIQFKEHELIQNGVYEVYFDYPNGRKSPLAKYLLINGFEYEFLDSPYIYKDKGLISFKNTNEIIIKPALEFIEKKEENLFLFKINPQINYITFIVEINKNIKVFLKFRLPVFRWKFSNDSEWRIDRPEYFWYEDFKNEFMVDFPIATKIQLFLDNDIESQVIGVKKDGVFLFNIIKLLSFINENRKHYLEIKIYEKNDNTISFKFEVLSKSAIRNVVLSGDYINGRILGIFDIVGRAQNYSIDIVDSAGEEIVKDKPLINGKIEIKKDFKQDVYQVKIYEVNSDNFGFGSQKRIIGIKYLELIDPFDLTDSEIELLSIKIGIFVRKFSVKYVVTNLKKAEVDGEYFGEMFIVNGKEKIFCSEFNPVLIELKHINDLSRVFIKGYFEGEWVELIYDEKKQSQVITEDPEIPKRQAYQNYTMLYEDEAEFKINIKKVKKHEIQTY